MLAVAGDLGIEGQRRAGKTEMDRIVDSENRAYGDETVPTLAFFGLGAELCIYGWQNLMLWP